MKHSFSLILTGALSLVLCSLPSCSKLFDYLDQHRDDVATHCQIQMLAVQIQSSNTNAPVQHYAFTYNAAGKPLSIIAQDPNVPFYSGNHFGYDRYGRLKDFQITDANFTFTYVWHRYTYPAPNTVIDTTYTYAGHVGDANPPPGTTVNDVTKITLDWKGRPVKYTQLSNNGSGPLSSSEVQYDANGNLVSPGTIYDDKINIYQTNPVWQFVFGNYSRNNPYIPARNGFPPSIPSYDQYGLPLVLQYWADPPVAQLFGIPYSIMHVTYACDPGTWR